MSGLRDDLGPATHPGADGQECRAQAPGRTGARFLTHIGSSSGHQRLGHFLENPVEVADIVGAGPLLRTENRRRPMRAEQRVGDVAREVDLDIGQPRIQPAEISSVKIGQSGRVRGQLAAVGRQPFHSQAGQHARPAVGGRAATEPDDEAVGRVVQGVTDQIGHTQ